MAYAESPMRATCKCGADCGVLESFMQATRAQPMRSLGYYAFCPQCQVSFPIEYPQLRVEV